MARRTTTINGKAKTAPGPRGPFIYIGPDLPGIRKGNTFKDAPEKLPHEEACPAVRTLLVPITEYMEARKLAEARGTTYHQAVVLVERYRKGVK